MRSLLRRAPVGLPGLVGTVRSDRRVRALLPRLRPGDVAVLDVQDVDADTARALLDARVAAVVNTGPMVSGRYPTLGPSLLAAAGVILVDGVGQAGFDALAGLDGRPARLYAGTLNAPEEVAAGREVDGAMLTRDLEAARGGLAIQLESLDRDGSALVHDEADLLLHGQGLPHLRTRVAGRPVVVVAPGPGLAGQLKGLRHYLREQRPVVVAVEDAIAAVRRSGIDVDVAVLAWGASLPGEPPATAADLTGVTDVIVRLAPGDSEDVISDLQRQGLTPQTVESAVASADLALLLAHEAGAEVIVGVGTGRTLEQLIDARGGDRGGDTASHVPTQLRVGARLVDASAVAGLYSGRVRPRHVLLVLLVGILAVAVAVATTPVGHHWATHPGDGGDTVQRWLHDARHWIADTF